MRPIISSVVAVLLAAGVAAAGYFTEFSVPLLYAGVGLVLGVVCAVDAHRRDVERTFPSFGLPSIGVFAVVAYGWPVALPYYWYATRPAAAPSPPRASTATPRPSAATGAPGAPGAPPTPRPSTMRPSFRTVRVSRGTLLIALFALLVPVSAAAASVMRVLAESKANDVAVSTGLLDRCLAVAEISRSSFGILQLDVHRAVGVDSYVYPGASEGIARTALASHPQRDNFDNVVVRFLTYRFESSMDPDSVAAWYRYAASDLSADAAALAPRAVDDSLARRFVDLAIAGDSAARSMLLPDQQRTDTVLGSEAFRARFAQGVPDSIVRLTCGSFTEPSEARRHRYLLHFANRLEIFDVALADLDTATVLVRYRHMPFDNAVLEVR